MLWQQALSRRLYKFVRFIKKYSNSTPKYSSLFTFRPETPVFIGIPRGEELFVSLHPLFTTLHRFQRSTGINCSARLLDVKERCKTARLLYGGCVISLNNSWRITVDHRMHITCCACAYQLLCKRTTAVVRPKILAVSTTYSYSSNNKKRVNHKLMTHPPPNQPG